MYSKISAKKRVFEVHTSEQDSIKDHIPGEVFFSKLFDRNFTLHGSSSGHSVNIPPTRPTSLYVV